MNHSNSFSLESFEFTGSIVPIASYLMVRSEFYNGAISSWVNILSLYWLEALYFLFDEQIHLMLMMNPYWCFITQLFSEMTHRPYILEFYIINILFLSFSHPSIYPYPFFFISIDNLEAYFLINNKKRFQLLQQYEQYIISWLILWIQIIRSDELVITSIVICLYRGAGFLY